MFTVVIQQKPILEHIKLILILSNEHASWKVVWILTLWFSAAYKDYSNKENQEIFFINNYTFSNGKSFTLLIKIIIITLLYTFWKFVQYLLYTFFFSL